MKVVDFVGLVVIQCEICGQKYVVEATKLDRGYIIECPCKKNGTWSGRGTQLKIELTHVTNLNSTKREASTRHAMPLNEYKRLLADFIITGKKPKVKREHSNVVSFDSEESQYRNLYETLRQFGDSKDEAFAKIDVALKEGLRMDTEMIKYILSLE